MSSALVRPSFAKFADQRLGLGLGQLQLVDDDDASRLGLGRQRMLQAERAHLLRQVVLMAADDRAVGLAAAAELRSASRMVTGAARTLLLVHLGAGARDFGAALGLVRALLLLGELPAHDALQDVLARIEAEDLVGELHLAGVLAGEGCDLEIHYSAPSVAGASVLAAARIAAGFGALAGSADLDGVADQDPGALRARNRAADQDQAAVGVGRNDLEVLRGDARRRPCGRPSSCP